MSPLDYILASVGGVQLGVIVYLVYQTISAMKGERAALAVASINERAQRDAERERDHALEHVAQLLKERDAATAQLVATQAVANAAAEEKTHEIETDLAAHPDRAGDAVTQLLAHRIDADGAIVAPADGAGHPVATAVQPAAAAQADRVHRDP